MKAGTDPKSISGTPNTTDISQLSSTESSVEWYARHIVY